MERVAKCYASSPQAYKPEDFFKRSFFPAGGNVHVAGIAFARHGLTSTPMQRLFWIQSTDALSLTITTWSVG
jgi:hypothetical protein